MNEQMMEQAATHLMDKGLTNPEVISDIEFVEVKKEKMALCITKASLASIYPVINEENKVFDLYGSNMDILNLPYTLEPRSTCETDDSLLQIIPYTILFRENKETGKFEVFTYKRGIKSDEGRLVSNMSVGIGGHIDSEGDSLIDMICDATGREIEEETGLFTNESDRENLYSALAQGNFNLIYNNTDEVGKHHVGIALMRNVPNDFIFVTDGVEVTNSAWVELSELGNIENSQFEIWSQVIAKILASNLNFTLGMNLNETLKEYNSLVQMKAFIEETLPKYDSKETSPIEKAKKQLQTMSVNNPFDKLAITSNYSYPDLHIDKVLGTESEEEMNGFENLPQEDKDEDAAVV